MRKHDENRTRAPQPRPALAVEATPWGIRRKVAATDAFELHLELIGAGANLGVRRAAQGQLTVVVLSGLLFVREGSRKITRVVPGQSFTSKPGAAFQLGTGRRDTRVLVVQPVGFDRVLERIDGTANRLARLPVDPGAPRRPQPTFDERAATANAAQGLARAQPLPPQARTAADVTGGSFNVHGVNLTPVVPEP